MKILLVADNTETSNFVQSGLRDSGYEVSAVQDGGDAMALASSEEWDLFILDRMLPDVDSMQIVTNLRAMGISAPVLLLMASGDSDDCTLGMNIGVIDYLYKPFALVELAARVTAVRRRLSI